MDNLITRTINIDAEVLIHIVKRGKRNQTISAKEGTISYFKILDDDKICICIEESELKAAIV